MLQLTLSSIFAYIFLRFATNALPKGYAFLRHGLRLIRIEVDAGRDYRYDVVTRRIISEAGAFVIGGAFWLSAGIGGALGGIVFGWQGFSLLIGGS